MKKLHGVEDALNFMKIFVLLFVMMIDRGYTDFLFNGEWIE